MPIREGELLSIVWSDLDLDRDRLVLAEPEKGGIARTLLLPERAVRALRAHRARQAEVVRGGQPGIRRRIRGHRKRTARGGGSSRP
ncbi:MAG: hypothetical protein H0X18_17255 [Geodermatophilaceae bacterium]|nr:hypothetical protein [Geodermatophilaceae bacterium]